MPDWVEELFVRKSHLFLRVMNAMWRVAIPYAAAIERILRSFDIPPGSGPILDLMCGNGRIGLHLAEKGYEVVGIDISPAFVEDARRRAKLMGVEDRVEFVVGDARDVDSVLADRAPFAAVINVWTSLGYYSKEDDIRILRGARRLTREGGLLIVADTVSQESVMSNFCERTYVESEDTLILHFATFDPVDGVIDDLWRFYAKEAGGNLRFLGSAKVRVRLYSLSEFKDMLEASGWKVVAMYDSILSMEPARWNSPINVVAKAVSRRILDEIGYS